jgi:hypothetical protein
VFPPTQTTVHFLILDFVGERELLRSLARRKPNGRSELIAILSQNWPMSSRLDTDRGPALLASTWSMTALAFLFLVLRFAARFSKRAFGTDDWFMLLSWVSLRLLELSEPCMDGFRG